VDEHTFRRFQTIMHVVSTIGAVVVFFVGLQRYHTEQANLLRMRVEAEQWARSREFRRDLWLRQIDVLSKVADTAGHIAVTVADGELTAFDSTVKEYERLYGGNVTFVDDPDLARAMDALRHEIRYFRQGLKPLDGLSASDKVKQKAYGVAIACRRAIHKINKEIADSVNGGRRP
jgi:hypothetical protein